ncbi:hypothetical protein HRbin39_01314 [bacterium HR39]|nr:hypothetical protein HRbin39_01314 [bacterium HR39]
MDAKARQVVLEHRARDGVVFRTVLAFEPTPVELSEERARFRLRVPPGERRQVHLWVGVEREGRERAEPPRAFGTVLRTARREWRQRGARAATIESSNEIFNQVICRAVSDLCMLRVETPHGPYPHAGIPWFATPCGRDGLVTALESLWMDAEIARGVLRFLAATRAREMAPFRDAEPGRILQEMRAGGWCCAGRGCRMPSTGCASATCGSPPPRWT